MLICRRRLAVSSPQLTLTSVMRPSPLTEAAELLAAGVIPALQVGNAAEAEAILVFGAVELVIDSGVVALLLQKH
jgi:hypothetical protein